MARIVARPKASRLSGFQINKKAPVIRAKKQGEKSMSDQLDQMIARVRKGAMTRREFVGRTTAMGVSAALAGALFTKAAHAEEPKKRRRHPYRDAGR